MSTDSTGTAFDVAEYNRRIAEDGAADLNQPIVAAFREAGGPTGVFSGAPILLLTTMGARSGRPSTVPLAYTRQGESYVVVASRAGAPVHPAWYHNLGTRPTATIEVGREAFEVRCRFAQGEARERLFAGHLGHLPTVMADLMRQYERQTTRSFPVVVLERVPSERQPTWHL